MTGRRGFMSWIAGSALAGALRVLLPMYGVASLEGVASTEPVVEYWLDLGGYCSGPFTFREAIGRRNAGAVDTRRLSSVEVSELFGNAKSNPRSPLRCIVASRALSPDCGSIKMSALDRSTW